MKTFLNYLLLIFLFISINNCVVNKNLKPKQKNKINQIDSVIYENEKMLILDYNEETNY